MKHVTQKKLASYASLAGSILVTHSSASAQIVHVDPPDVILAGVGSVSLDLDNNGSVDFIFNVTNSGSYPGGKVDMDALNYNNEVLGRGSACGGGYLDYQAYILESGDVIKNTYKWKVVNEFEFGELCNLDSFLSYPCKVWAGEKNKFLGVRFNDASDHFHYGWIRMSVGSKCNRIIIKDWAYNSVINAPIVAGQTSKLSDEQPDNEEVNSLKDLAVFGNGDQVYIEDNLALLPLEINIYNLMGQQLASVKSSDQQTIIQLPGLSPGVYIVRLKNDQEMISSEVVIQ